MINLLRGWFFLTILFIPSYGWRFSLGSIPWNIFEVLVAVGAFLYLIQNQQRLKNEFWAHKKYNIPIGMMLTGLVLSMSHNEVYRMGLGIIKSWFVLPMIFSWLSFKVLKKEEILKGLYFSSLGVSFLAYIYFVLEKITFDGRWQGFYNSPNFLAMYVASGIISGLYLIKKSKFYWLGLAIIAGVFYETQSYFSWMGVFFAVGAVFFLENRKINVKKIAGTVLFAEMIFFLQMGTEKMQSLIHLDERSSLSSRQMIWQSAIKIGLDNWFYGIGPGNFQNKYLEYQKYFSPYLEWAVPQPHNLFLAFWLQTGFVGAVGFLWLTVLGGKELLKIKKENAIRIFYGGIWLYFIFHGLADTTYFKNDLAVVFWIAFFGMIDCEKIKD